MRKFIAWALLAFSLLCIAFGFVYRRQIYDVPDAVSAALGEFSHRKISDRDLTIDATFSGVKREDGRLWSTYDRTVKAGKRACPT